MLNDEIKKLIIVFTNQQKILNKLAEAQLTQEEERIKLQLNKIVVEVIAKTAFPELDKTSAQNEAFFAILYTPVHEYINTLTKAIFTEIKNIKNR